MIGTGLVVRDQHGRVRQHLTTTMESYDDGMWQADF